ncbi:MAG: PIN domain nuclease, partial [Acidobacteria bacterium]|nr:PIN domain nuclease [Acidobacteriota bacterium]
MQLDFLIIRIGFTALLVGAGYLLSPIPGERAMSAGLALLIAAAIIFFETRVRRLTLKTLIGAAVGSILGIVGATLIGFLISAQDAVPKELGSFVTLALTLFMAYVGLIVGAAKGDFLDLSAL